jgi:predicted Zn-ribbon and HTH transcriptional regulator
MNGIEVSGMETTVDVQHETRTLDFDLLVNPNELPDEFDFPAVEVTRDINGRLQTQTKAIPSETEEYALKDVIEESTGRRPEGHISHWDTTVEGDPMYNAGSRLPDEENSEQTLLYVQCSFTSPMEMRGGSEEEEDMDTLDQALGESYEEKPVVNDTAVRRVAKALNMEPEEVIQLSDLRPEAIENIHDMINEETMYDELQTHIQEAQQTAKGVQAAGDGEVEFEATCNECGGPMDGEQSIEESLCTSCQELVCGVDGCEARPDDFHDHMIDEHGWYTEELDPTADV